MYTVMKLWMYRLSIVNQLLFRIMQQVYHSLRLSYHLQLNKDTKGVKSITLDYGIYVNKCPANNSAYGSSGRFNTHNTCSTDKTVHNNSAFISLLQCYKKLSLHGFVTVLQKTQPSWVCNTVLQ